MGVAADHKCHLILMGYKKDEDPLENSIIHHVISHQPCDIAILKSDNISVDAFKRLLIPIAGREVHDRLKARFIHCLLPGEEGQITLMTVIPLGSGIVRRQRALQSLERATKLYHLPSAELVVDESSQVAQAIIQRARDHDLLILGMRREPWLKAFFFGTLAQQVAGQVQCATILTKVRAPRKSVIKSLFKISKD